MPIRCAVITVSDKGFSGEREDTSGPLLKQLLQERGHEVVILEVVPDDRATIEERLRTIADKGRVDLVITNGGTGPAPRDVTPEATLAVIEKEMPGITELLRAESYKKTPHGVLSRGRAGIRRSTLIINLPGSPKAVKECLVFLDPVLPHAIELIKGEFGEH